MRAGYLPLGKRLTSVLEPFANSVVGRFVVSIFGALGITGRTGVISIPFFWLGIFFLIPFAFVLKISLSESILAIPPYSDLIEWGEEGLISLHLNFGNFLFLLEDDLYWFSYVNSAKIALISTFFCLLIGYPMAYGINGMTRPSFEGVNLQQLRSTMQYPATPPASRTRLSGGIRFRKGSGPRRRAVWGRYSPSGCWSAGKAVFGKHPAGSGFPCAPEPATVSAPFHCGAGSLAIRKTRKAAMAHSRRIRLLGATMISTSFTHSRNEP